MEAIDGALDFVQFWMELVELLKYPCDPQMSSRGIESGIVTCLSNGGVSSDVPVGSGFATVVRIYAPYCNN